MALQAEGSTWPYLPGIALVQVADALAVLVLLPVVERIVEDIIVKQDFDDREIDEMTGLERRRR